MKKKVFGSCAEAISDDVLFRQELIHSAVPGLAGLVGAGDTCAGIERLARRMQGKPAPSFSPFRNTPDGEVDPAERAKADDILNGIFTLSDGRGDAITETLTGNFEWSPSFEGEQVYHPPKVFRYQLNQHTPLTTLASIYWRTGERKYQDRLITLLLDWIRRVPTYWTLLASGECRRQHWQNMMTRNRFENWLNFYPLIAPGLSNRDAVDLLKAMIFHARLMIQYVTDNMGSRISGTLAGMIKVNLKFALLFPETTVAKDSIESFKTHFKTATDSVFYPDGGLKFRCTGYHRAVAGWYVQAVRLAEELGIQGIDDERQMARKMEAYTAFLMKPDASLPLLGDTGPGRDETWRDQKLAELKPDTPSQAFEWSGLYAMRSGWDRDACYLFFTAGPYGTMHNHQDHLSFEISSYGKHLIVEPGLTPYGRTEQRRQIGTSAAHNTLTVDGLGQHRTHVQPDGPSRNAWFTCPAFDFVEGRFEEGFGPNRSVKVSHIRSILFVKPKYFLVVDRVLGHGAHDLTWHFMFYPQSLNIARGENRVVSDEPEGANISFAWSDARLEPELVIGETHPPYRGLMTCADDRPAPSLFLSRRAELPLTVAFLIEPVAPGKFSSFLLKPGDVANGTAFRIDGNDGEEDTIFFPRAGERGLSPCGPMVFSKRKGEGQRWPENDPSCC